VKVGYEGKNIIGCIFVNNLYIFAIVRKLATILLLSSCLSVFGQYNLDYGFHAGASNYLGDIGGGSGSARGFVMDMKLKKTQFTTGAFVRYKFTPIVAAKLGLNWVRIAGDDKLSTNRARAGRNLSFRNDLIELELTVEGTFFQIADLGHTYQYRNDLKLYLFAGVAGFYNNPKAQYDGSWVALRPLHTEGVKYNAVGVSIPAGLGCFVTLNRKNRIGIEIDGRMSFTDYIDDVSTVYADPNTLSSPEAKALANRRPELGNSKDYPSQVYYTAGQKRGDPKRDDAYISASVSYSRVIRGKSSFYKSKYGSIFKPKKGKKRKVRAKF
jgi:hypothetical protein